MTDHLSAYRDEINRLRVHIIELAVDHGYNDRTIGRLIGVDPTGFRDEWPNLPDREIDMPEDWNDLP